MNDYTVRATLGAILAALVVPAAWVASMREPPEVQPAAAETREVAHAPPVRVVPGDMPDVLGAVADLNAAVSQYLEAIAVAAYLDALEAQRLRDEAEAQARAAAAARATRASSAPVRVGGSTVGDCTGFAIPDYIIQRESGGNPSAANPSGAYGCAQTLLSHYYGGSCSGLDPYTIDGQRQCVWILSNGGTNLSPWAQTR